ncbi:hypothetical protein GYMLUDRAFT_45305 [Collybiopsis luxurians FD-317 M1]|uniref:Cyclase n=1 Tax=Collybiopsis luxurians FD-317 M1 TaxID=944289 RepID=A0A0D0CJ91_9AGAR|nr:hypothetical protein GYMLUDRAFT_45305 [Collybiopsis luxurians FD-317 M1]
MTFMLRNFLFTTTIILGYSTVILHPQVRATPIPPPKVLVSRAFNSSDPYANWPTYDELPLHPSFPTKAAWGVWGPDDEFGALNHIRPATIRAAKDEIKEGIAINLNLELDIPNPPLVPTRPAIVHAFIPFEGYQDDVLTLNTQVSTQFDGLRHYPYSTNGSRDTYQFYNDLITFDDIFSPGASVKTLGIQNAAQKGIAGRGVLLDWAGWKESRNETFDVFSPTAITASELDQVAIWQGLDPSNFTKPGDWLIFRTAFIKQYLALPISEQEQLPFKADAAYIGLEASEDTLRWVWEKKISMLGSDNLAVEKFPVGAVILGHTRALHEIFISGWGQSLVELLNLEALAEKCHELNRFSFFFTLQDLNVAGGIASPPNAMAIF